MNLVAKALLYSFSVIVGIGAVLFFVADSIFYLQGWLYLLLFAAISTFIILYLGKYDQALLARRMKGGAIAEKEAAQKIIMLIVTFAYIAIHIIPALDYRFGWSNMPFAISLFGAALFFIGYAIIFLVFRANTYTSATIELADKQTVVSTGPYAFVRHPMYSGSVIMFIGIPLTLGSYWGLLVVIPIIASLVWRLLDEETFLSKQLDGYREYCQKVRFRLIPGIF